MRGLPVPHRPLAQRQMPRHLRVLTAARRETRSSQRSLDLHPHEIGGRQMREWTFTRRQLLQCDPEMPTAPHTPSVAQARHCVHLHRHSIAAHRGDQPKLARRLHQPRPRIEHSRQRAFRPSSPQNIRRDEPMRSLSRRRETGC